LHGKNVSDEMQNFYKKYLPLMMNNYQLKDNARAVINRLKEAGHKIIIITARGYTKGLGQEEITKAYFKKHGIVVDKIIFGKRKKCSACIEEKLDLMVDDSVRIVEDLKNSGIKSVLFNSICNAHEQINIDRVNNWLELEEYINNLKK